MSARVRPEKAALDILDIFIREFESNPDRIISFMAFMAVWNKRELPVNAFTRGMEFAARAGWVEIIAARASYRLTQAGYERVSVPAAVKGK